MIGVFAGSCRARLLEKVVMRPDSVSPLQPFHATPEEETSPSKRARQDRLRVVRGAKAHGSGRLPDNVIDKIVGFLSCRHEIENFAAALPQVMQCDAFHRSALEKRLGATCGGRDERCASGACSDGHCCYHLETFAKGKSYAHLVRQCSIEEVYWKCEPLWQLIGSMPDLRRLSAPVVAKVPTGETQTSIARVCLKLQEVNLRAERPEKDEVETVVSLLAHLPLSVTSLKVGFGCQWCPAPWGEQDWALSLPSQLGAGLAALKGLKKLSLKHYQGEEDWNSDWDNPLPRLPHFDMKYLPQALTSLNILWPSDCSTVHHIFCFFSALEQLTQLKTLSLRVSCRNTSVAEPNFLPLLLQALPADLTALRLSGNLLGMRPDFESTTARTARNRLSNLTDLGIDWFVKCGHLNGSADNTFKFDRSSDVLHFLCGQGSAMVKNLRLGILPHRVESTVQEVFRIPEGIKSADILVPWHYEETFGGLLGFMYAVSLTLPDSLEHLRLRAKEYQCDIGHDGYDTILDPYHVKIIKSIFEKEERTVDLKGLCTR